MAETKPIQIFLCHASEDKTAVLEIYDRLKDLGYKPWLDKKDLLPGQYWRREIPKAIRTSDFILIFPSKTSVAKRGYVQNEFKLALEVLREIPEGTIYAIPVRLDDCPIPDQFSDLQWCNFFEADGFETLLRAFPQPKSFDADTRKPFEPELILIPAGEFLMGSNPQQDMDASDDEQPQHRLLLPDYFLAKTPVTHAQYREFVRATGHEAPQGWTNGTPPPDKEDHPVVYVSWYDAGDYCQWLAQVTGKDYRLPTEAEWEKGARGIDGRIYPWGNQWDATRCNSRESGLGETTPVHTYPQGASSYGVLDTAGNVWEWTRSLWGTSDRRSDYRYPYRPTDGRGDLAAGQEVARVLRGGTFYYNRRIVRCACRGGHYPNYRYNFIGFRVVVLPVS